MTTQDKNSRALIILGAHRSGTSSLTGVLHHLGVALGDRLVPAREGVNDRGFWEQSDIISVHDRLLDSLGSRWDSIHPLPDNWWVTPGIEPFAKEIQAILTREFGNEHLWGVKDPRLCNLLPLWLDILEQTGNTPAFILIYRNPLEVADSLLQRDQMEVPHALALWLQQVLSAEFYSRAGPRIFISYEELLDDWRTMIGKIANGLSLEWPEDPDNVDGVINQFLEPALRHNRHTADDVASQANVSRWIKETYSALRNSGTVEEKVLMETFDRIRHECDSARSLYSPILQSEEHRLRDVETGFVQACETIDQYQADADQLKATLSDIDKGFQQAMDLLKEKDEALQKANAILTPKVKALAEVLGASDNGEQEKQSEGAAPAEDEDKVYEAVIDLRVYNNSHTQLFTFIQEDSGGKPSRILEVGCSTGYFGEALKDAGHEVWGVELSSTAAKRARQRLDHVFVGTIEEFLACDAVQGVGFDYITFGDVLEHLVNPEKVLEDCKGILTANGAVTASIPNIAHKAARVMLLQGRWDYAEFGILDNTHLRFFTRDSIVDTFSRSGFDISVMDSVDLAPDQTGIDFDQHLLETLSEFIQDEDQDIFQCTLLAHKSADNTDQLLQVNARFRRGAAPRVLCLLPLTDWTVGDIRIRHPLAKFRQKYGGEVRIRNVFEPRPEDLDWSDTIVLQRESNRYVVGLIQVLQTMGKRIIFDMDDLLTCVPPFLVCYEHSVQVKPYLEEALRMVDAITVTTDRLKQEMQAYNRNVRVVPNCAETTHVRATHDSGANTKVSLLVASSDTVRVDFIVPVLQRIIKDPELDIEIIGIGPPGEYLQEAGLPVQVHANMGYEHFKAFLATLNNTVGIIPLEDSRFSNCKSPIKYLDFSLAGIPSICSDVPPYSDTIENDVTGILCPNEEDNWFKAIRGLALSSDTRTRIAQAANRFCLETYSMRRAAGEWHQLFVETQPGQGQAGSYLLRSRYHVPQLFRHALNPEAYRSAFRVLREEGFQGVRTRMARHL